MRSTSGRLGGGALVALCAFTCMMRGSWAAASAGAPAGGGLDAVPAPTWPRRYRLRTAEVPPARHRITPTGALSEPCPLRVRALIAGEGVAPLAVIEQGGSTRTLRPEQVVYVGAMALTVTAITSRSMTLTQGEAVYRCALAHL